MRLLCRIMFFVLKDFVMGSARPGVLSSKMVISCCSVPLWHTPPTAFRLGIPASPIPLRKMDDHRSGTRARGDPELFWDSRGGHEWCRGPESNWLRPPFQGGALPVSYPGTLGPKIVGAMRDCVKLANHCMDSSNSFIQARFLSTSRGLVPSGGPTIPSFSIKSIRRAARP